MVIDKKRLRLALFISGGATTANSIIAACKSGRLKIDPVLVIASRKNIAGIERVQKAGFPKKDIAVINPEFYKDIGQFAERLLTVCRRYQVDLVGQYGWLPLTPKKFIQEYHGRIINQHPGPLDPPRVDFGGKGMYGRRVHAAILYFRRATKHDFWTEAVTHFVTEEFDKGEVIKRRQIKMQGDDTVEDLQKRVLPVEHEVQIEALDDFVKGRVKIYKRDKPLVNKNELKTLTESKKIAAILYPYG